MPTELRVHGVSGTPPDELLYTGSVSYDQSPEMARVFEANRDTWQVKAFHWGSLTSRNALTALWILLAPFAMANVAGWMSDRPNVWSRIWVRVAGLALTGIFFAQAANMALDVPVSSGVAGRWATSIYAVFCIVFVVGLGLISTQSSFRKLGLGTRLRHVFWPGVEAMNPDRAAPDWADPVANARLVGTSMWGLHSFPYRLRRIHLGFGMAVLAIVAARNAGSPDPETAALVLAAICLITLGLSAGPVATWRPVVWITAWLTPLGAGILTWSLITLSGFEASEASVNVADDLTFQISLILGAAAGLAFVGEIILSRLRGGLASLGLLAIGALIGATYGLTGSMLVETYLVETPAAETTFEGGAAFVTVAMLGLVAAIALTFVVCMLVPRSGDESAVRRGAVRARVSLAMGGIYAIAIGVVAVLASCGQGDGCRQSNIEIPEFMREDPEALIRLFGLPFDPGSVLGWAKILMVAVPALLIIRSIVGGLLNGQDARRKVGIVWDLGSFWPRWFHPLGPPAYGPYAVTRLQTTIDRERPDVLAAHSQGSLISAVAVCLTDIDSTPNRLVTYGSQIGELYPRLFPGVGFEELTAVTDGQLGGSWVNLWRPSDPIGGQVIESLGDRNWIVHTGRGHSRYELTPEFCASRKMGPERPDDEQIERCWDSP